MLSEINYVDMGVNELGLPLDIIHSLSDAAILVGDNGETIDSNLAANELPAENSPVNQY